MCQMHPNSDVQLWNFWLWIHILHFKYVWNLPTLSLALFFINHIEFRTMCMHCAVFWKFSSVDLTHFFLLLFQIFDKEGQFKFSFGVPGKDEGQLFYPRKIAVLRDSGYYVICDRGSERSRMQIFSPMGHFIRRIPIRFIDIVAGLAISREGTYLHYLRHNVYSKVLG